MANNKFIGVYKDKYNFFTGFGEDYTFENKSKILANYYNEIPKSRLDKQYGKFWVEEFLRYFIGTGKLHDKIIEETINNADVSKDDFLALNSLFYSSITSTFTNNWRVEPFFTKPKNSSGEERMRFANTYNNYLKFSKEKNIGGIIYNMISNFKIEISLNEPVFCDYYELNHHLPYKDNTESYLITILPNKNSLHFDITFISGEIYIDQRTGGYSSRCNTDKVIGFDIDLKHTILLYIKDFIDLIYPYSKDFDSILTKEAESNKETFRKMMKLLNRRKAADIAAKDYKILNDIAVVLNQLNIIPNIANKIQKEYTDIEYSYKFAERVINKLLELLNGLSNNKAIRDYLTNNSKSNVSKDNSIDIKSQVVKDERMEKDMVKVDWQDDTMKISKATPETNSNKDMMTRFKEIVADYSNEHIDKTDGVKVTTDDVYIVWFCKTLQNWKALLSTSIRDGMYYELTMNGDKKEIYLDAYKKWENRVIKL